MEDIYSSIYIFNAHLLILLYVFAMLASHHIKEAAFGRLHNGGRLQSAAVPPCGFLYMVAAEVASIAKAYRRISKCVLNMYIDAYLPYSFGTPIIPIFPYSVTTLPMDLGKYGFHNTVVAYVYIIYIYIY